MKINKIRPKFHFLTKIEKKNDLPRVCVLLFTVSSPLEPFGSRFIETSIKRLPNGSSSGEESVNNKTQIRGKSFLFLILSKNGI